MSMDKQREFVEYLKENPSLADIMDNLDLDFSIRTHNNLMKIMKWYLKTAPDSEEGFRDEMLHLDIIRADSSFYVKSDLHPYCAENATNGGAEIDGVSYYKARNFGKLSFMEFVDRMHAVGIPLSRTTEETYSKLTKRGEDRGTVKLSTVKQLFNTYIARYPHMFTTDGKIQLKLFMELVEWEAKRP